MKPNGPTAAQRRGNASPLWSDSEKHLAQALLAKGVSLVRVSLELEDATGIERTHDAVKKMADKHGWKRSKAFVRWSDEEVQALRSLVAAGADRSEIAAALGIDYARVRQKIRNLRLNVPRPCSTNQWPESDFRRLKDLAKSNLSAAEIGKRIGRSKCAVIGKAHRTGVDLGRLVQRQ